MLICKKRRNTLDRQEKQTKTFSGRLLKIENLILRKKKNQNLLGMSPEDRRFKGKPMKGRPEEKYFIELTKWHGKKAF